MRNKAEEFSVCYKKCPKNKRESELNYILEELDIFPYKKNINYILHKCENDNGIFKKDDILLIRKINKFNKKYKPTLTISNTEIGHVIGYIREDNIIKL